MLKLITAEEYDIELEIAYATANNFVQKPVYKNPYCYLHQDAADSLARANNLAKAIGFRIKIFDAFRPLEAQWALWNHTPDPNFVSHPETGLTTHCRGVAVDLTLVDENNKELDMGTEFDAFTPLSFHSCTEISKAAQQNRLILLGIMTAAGWDFFKNEWWHYQLHNPRNYQKLTDAEAHTNMM